MRWQNIVQVGIIPLTINTVKLQKRPTKKIQKRKAIEIMKLLLYFYELVKRNPQTHEKNV